MMKKTLLAGLLATACVTTGVAQAAESILTALPEQRTAWVANYNPFNQTTRLPSVPHFMFEPLIIFNSMAGGKPEFRLATDFAYSDDLSSVTVTLRKGVKWSDGEGFDADDVIKTFDMVLGNVALDAHGMNKLLKSVEKVDESTVRFNLINPSSQAMYQIVRVSVIPEHIWKDVKDPVTFTNPEPVGSGPLTQIKRFTPQEYIQCRNEHYWDGETLKVDCMRFPQISNNDQALAAAAKGELDWMGSFLPDIENTYVAKDPENHKYWLPAGNMVSFFMNFESPKPGNKEAFTDVSFRRIVSMSFDREAMVEIAGYGYPTINEYASGLGRSYHAWHSPETEEKFGKYSRFDIDGAKKLLAEKGYKDADGDGFIDTPSGKPIDIEIIVPNGWTDWVNSCQIAVEGLNALGINARIATPEQAIWTEKLINATYDIAINSVPSGPTPYTQFQRAYHEKNQGKSRFAALRYYSKETSALLDDFTQTTDPKEQKAIMDKLQMQIASDLPMVTVFNNPYWYQYNTKRFTGFFNAENPKAIPAVHPIYPTRLLHLLSLRPVE